MYHMEVNVKRIIIYLLTIIFICFSIPILFAKPFEFQETLAQTEENVQVNNIQEDVENQTNYDYKEYGSIKLYHSKTETIEDINLDEYLLRCCIC